MLRMRLLLTACFALLCAPAYAEECLYFTQAGNTLDLNEEDQSVRFVLGDETIDCDLGPNGDAYVAYCDFGEVDIKFENYQDSRSPIEAFKQIWNVRCYEPT